MPLAAPLYPLIAASPAPGLCIAGAAHGKGGAVKRRPVLAGRGDWHLFEPLVREFLGAVPEVS